MDFLTYFREKIEHQSVVSIIGLAKNVSKTTTLNYLISNLKDITLGLTSIGRDGEKYDIITDLPKPRILIKEGTIIATARKSFEETEIQMEILKTTEINTPLGEILILRALDTGLVELAGPSINKNLQIICSELRELGCDLILIDGAFDRRSYATPLISDATILSTGASVSKNMQKVINLTAHTIKLFSLDIEKDFVILKIAEDIFKSSKVGIINNDNTIKLLEISTSLDSASDIIEYLDNNTKYLVINGAITDKLLKDMMKLTTKFKDIVILVDDATKLFLSELVLTEFQKKGGILKVINPINIIAVTINPTSPYGYEFNKDDFLKLLRERTSTPIYDLGAHVEN
jgi:hypothetical protein